MANETNRTTPMIALPAMPSKAKAKPTRPCHCGCGQPTKSMWASGHDGRATGWAVRIERGVMGIGDVPANERRGAMHMLLKRAVNDEATEKAIDWVKANIDAREGKTEAA